MVPLNGTAVVNRLVLLRARGLFMYFKLSKATAAPIEWAITFIEFICGLLEILSMWLPKKILSSFNGASLSKSSNFMWMFLSNLLKYFIALSISPALSDTVFESFETFSRRIPGQKIKYS